MRNSLGTVDLARPVNWQHPLARGLLGWWLALPHDRGSRTFRNLATPLNHGTLTNFSTSIPTAWKADTHHGGAGSIEYSSASSRYVDCGAATAWNGLSEVSITAWIWPVQTGSFPVIMAKGTNSQREFQLFHYHNQNRLRFATVNASASTVTLDADNFLTYSDWQHVGATYRSGEMSLYHNGVRVATTSSQTGSIVNLTNSMQLGWIGTGASLYFTGKMDDNRFYNRHLNQNEMRQLYLNSMAGYPDLLNRWDDDELDVWSIQQQGILLPMLQQGLYVGSRA